MTVVKFCGLRRAEEVNHAKRLGCDLVGLNFVPASPRFLSANDAKKLVDSVRNKVQFVGVFRNVSNEDVCRTLAKVDLDFLQFHGTESADFCESFEMPYIKSVAVNEEFDLIKVSDEHPKAFAFLLDSPSTIGGGTGTSFAWERFPKSPNRRVLLAGGLHADNVSEAVSQVKPWGVDVASGIEGEHHKKDLQLMSRFIHEVRSVSA